MTAPRSHSRSSRHPLSIAWIRRDLRLSDHAALAAACAESDRVAVVFVFDTTILSRLHDRDDRRLSFIDRSLEELDAALRSRGSALIVRHGDPVDVVPRLCIELGACAVHVNRDHDPDARHRDTRVAEALASIGVEFHDHKDLVIFESDEILTGRGEPFRVFTPYKRAWLSAFSSLRFMVHPTVSHTPDLARLAPRADLADAVAPWSLEGIGFRRSTLWLDAGEQAAARRLKHFLTTIGRYHIDRDYPSIDGTSGLSVHLRFGTISIRECVRRVADAHRDNVGAQTWLSELIWREFYQAILHWKPSVVGHAFREEYDGIVWPGSEEHFTAWCEGRTGYPIIDAAMRCFAATGWMHNRLRMVTAGFLVKDLLVDWRRGEEHFARFLLDYDLAANNGGWQWSASTGCDAQPWFRIFNPVMQSRRFDPDGVFIRRWCPELDGVPSTAIHFPHGEGMLHLAGTPSLFGPPYPSPIVDHATQRDRALALFR